LGILLGFVPAGKAVGSGLYAAEEALATMEDKGTAVGFCDSRVKEGVGKGVVVGDALEAEGMETEAIPLPVALLAAPVKAVKT
jgi:hypothetical protein